MFLMVSSSTFVKKYANAKNVLFFSGFSPRGGGRGGGGRGGGGFRGGGGGFRGGRGETWPVYYVIVVVFACYSGVWVHHNF